MGLSILWPGLFKVADFQGLFNVQWEWVQTVDNAVVLGGKILNISSSVS